MNQKTSYRIEFSGVGISFVNKEGEPNRILSAIDLKIREGEFVCLLGPSGCGKSTLMNGVFGSLQQIPAARIEGTILVNNAPVDGITRHRGKVFQDHSLLPHLTVEENILYGLDRDQWSFPNRFVKVVSYLAARRKYREQARHYIEQIGLDPKKHGGLYPKELSGGMKQRVAFASALIMKPQVILMDEPFSALDPGIRKEMQEWMVQIRETERPTVICVTHDVAEACTIGTRLVVLSQHREASTSSRQKGNRAEGACIVVDIPASESGSSQNSDEVRALIRSVLVDYNEGNLLKPSQFQLTHPDAIKVAN